ncbi:MAG: cytochrome c [Rhizomicrobium sp.]|jgi:mono/diheme cytochrome c family protein
MSGSAQKLLAYFGIACLALGTVVIVYLVSGLYNVGADSEHAGLMHWTLAFVRERSVDAHGEDIMPPKLDDPKMIAAGAGDYDEMCSGCHLAPGMAENELRPGLNPKPPILAKDPPDSAGEAFWVVKHGIKMTGMPAWGVTHTDQELWPIVAFLLKQPTLTPEQYKALVAQGGGHHAHGKDSMPPGMKM